MEKKKIPVALMIAAGMLLYNNTVAAQSLLPTQETSQHQLSFNEALQLLHKGNQSLKIADKGIDIARAERGKLNAFWMPSLQSTGAFVHLSEKIEVKQPLSQFTDPAKDFVHSILPDDKIISSILDQIGTNTLIFPLAPRNLTTVDLTAEWVLFAGGKRIHATKIGNTMIDLARENRAQTDATQRTLLAESYYGLRLAQEIVGVRLESYKALKLHYENALKLAARDDLITHNLRLVVYLAKKYESSGVPAEDMISIGTIGLIKAVNTFCPDKNIKLATYASRCIENEILMFLRKSNQYKNEISIDEPLNVDWDGNELLLSDILGTDDDTVNKGIESEVEKQLLLEEIEKLCPREKQIMKMRFGLSGKKEMTQKQVADEVGISQSYISRLEKRIIKSIRRNLEKIC